MNNKKYLKVKPFYWVPVFKMGKRSASIFSMKWSNKKPDPVPNPNMEWDHPTYEELILYGKRRTINGDE